MFKNYLKIAFRNLGRNKIYTFINVAGLSIGLACSMLIILYVKDEVSYDRFHADVQQIYRVTTESVDKQKVTRKDGNTGYFQGPRFHANVPDIASFVRVQSGSEDFQKGTDVSSHDVLYVDSTFFNIFSFPLIHGNPATCLIGPESVVLSEEEAKKQFGTADAVGKTLMIKRDNVFKPFKVTGVAKKTPQNSSIKFNVLMPLIVRPEEYQNSDNWFNVFLNTFVVLKPGSNVQTTEAKMQRFYVEDSKEALKKLTEQFGDMGWSSTYHLQPFTDMHLNKELPAQNGLSDASNPMYSYILSGIAIFILLIACINFVNLTIARSVRRAREIGIRKVIGSDRKQLIFQFLGESFVLCFFAFLSAIILVQLVLPIFNTLSNKALAIAYLIDIKLIGGYILLFLLTGLLAGFYPALVLSGYNPVETLYSRFNLRGKNYLQKSLVVLQFALASFLIIGTFTIYSQFKYLTNVELGYDDSQLVQVGKYNLTRAELATFKQELLKDPSIVGVTGKNGGFWGTAAKVNIDTIIQFAYETVDENYIPQFKLKLKEGRNFSSEFPSDSTHSVLVNESFVEKAGWKNPIGQEVNFWYRENEKYTVVGVVKDYHFESLNRKIGPQLFTMKPGNDFGVAFIKVKPGSETAALKHIEKTFKQMFRLSPFSYTFKDEENRRAYEAEQRWKQIMLFSAILTIFISCIGLFGLSVLAAEKRTKEIGIRKVLGASVSSVITILSTDFLKLVMISLLVSIPVAWIVSNKWLENYPYRVQLQWQLFAVAAIMVICIALFTVSFQAIRAAIRNPVKSLRTE